MSNDPRKAYANLKHLKCKELPEYLRMMRPDCRDDFKDRAIGPRPPRPPGPPPTPFVPKALPLYVPPDGIISPAIGSTILGVSALKKAQRLGRGRSLYPRDYETRTGRPPRARVAPARTMVAPAEAREPGELGELLEEEAPAPLSEEPRIGEPLIDDGAGVFPRANPVIQESRLPPRAEARPTTGRAITPRAGGSSSITGVSDVRSNPSVRPSTTPEPRRQLTQQRRITMPSAREGAGRTGIREPASLESWSDGGSGGIARDLPRADPPVTTQTRGGATFEGGGAGRGVGTEDPLSGRRRGQTTLRRRLSRVQGGDITSRPYGNLRMESFGVTAPEPVETERSEVIRSRGSIRGSGLATIPNSVESRIAPVPDDRMVDEFGATDPDLLPEMADDDLLRLPLVQRSTPKPRISAVRRALHAIDPQNRIQEAQRLIGNLVRPSPSAPSTIRYARWVRTNHSSISPRTQDCIACPEVPGTHVCSDLTALRCTWSIPTIIISMSGVNTRYMNTIRITISGQRHYRSVSGTSPVSAAICTCSALKVSLCDTIRTRQVIRTMCASRTSISTILLPGTQYCTAHRSPV